MSVSVRSAVEADIPRIMDLLSQVLEIHAAIRPDVFRPGTTKYSPAELRRILADDRTPVFAAVDETGRLIGYAFCVLKESSSAVMRPSRLLYIDDLCVDAQVRGRHIGKLLFDHAVGYARSLGCQTVTLNVWSGNDNAQAFYLKMGMRPRSVTMEYPLD
ncbi:MAG: GNAT family N-acetyltransferase [Eubacteriales bacterium]|nr:GNAT family N-acetyltransferase [Eubacteriales bacterium]